jgi:hypothetical protein
MPTRSRRPPPLPDQTDQPCINAKGLITNNTAIKHIKRTGRGFTNARNYKTRILLRSAARTAA